MADYPLDTTVTDHLLSTTRAVRKRLDLERPVEREVLLECLRLAVQSPTGSNSQNWHWVVVTDPAKRVRLKELYDGMARPYLESQAEHAADPQTKRVYQSAVYLLNILDRVPVHVIPCVEGRLDNPEPFAARDAAMGALETAQQYGVHGLEVHMEFDALKMADIERGWNTPDVRAARPPGTVFDGDTVARIEIQCSDGRMVVRYDSATGAYTFERI